MKWAYYNEHDAFAAAWLRKLIEAGAIAPGEVDERDIQLVTAAELREFTQCHFFAGIGVWSYALRQAGWPDDQPVWTGSCPCQPFSVSGKRAGASDGRHLWPVWFPLIRESRPITVFGEQVASDDGLAWLDLVSSDLEGQGYTVGAVDTCAAGFGAPHIRQRLYFCADAAGSRQTGSEVGRGDREDAGGRARGSEPERDGELGERAHAEHDGHHRPDGLTSFGFWRDCSWWYGRDGKYRPIEPGLFPLAHGSANRVGRLRGYGNALCAEQAIGFIRAYLETLRTSSG